MQANRPVEAHGVRTGQKHPFFSENFALPVMLFDNIGKTLA